MSTRLCWLHLLGRTMNEKHKSLEETQNWNTPLQGPKNGTIRITAKHFTEDQLEWRIDKKVLRWNAIPTVFNNHEGLSLKKRKLDPNTLQVDGFSTEEYNLNKSKEKYENLIKKLENQLELANKKIKELIDHNVLLKEKLKQTFEPEQVEILLKNSNEINWSPKTIQKSLKLYLTCGSTGYEELRKQNYPIPCIRTLQRKIKSFKCLPELHTEIFELLKTKSDVLLPEERHAVLLMDEMAIKPGFQYDNNSGEIIATTFTGLQRHFSIFFGGFSEWIVKGKEVINSKKHSENAKSKISKFVKARNEILVIVQIIALNCFV
ncbi:hypothetical protein TcasGA2_TC002756 [Tribolium castaneum]|uniref:Transposable element P transposase-like RNase H domain-containing protein n=1 Tax=Tribolium castaneum TaxID=7070 RepID=D6WDK7_TRICA|nr:hypothetical protein TcasGA2_TC002756 [Tribolium castaneum]